MRSASRHASVAGAAAGWAAAVTAVAVVGGLATDTSSEWYRDLEKPSWQPPGSVFGPVWTVLYVLIAVAATLSFRDVGGPRRRLVLGLYAANLALNVAWTWIFFQGHAPTAAGIEIVFLLATIVALIWLVRPHNRAAAPRARPVRRVGRLCDGPDLGHRRPQLGQRLAVVFEPKLIEVSVPARPEGAVLVLHGGASRGERMMVSPTQLSVLRMVPIARRIARAGGDRLAVYRLLNSRRGWDAHHTPVRDAQWALDRIADRLGALPVCLVGHSLGGRAALLAAARARGVVALAPWVYPTDVAPDLNGQRILFVHGADDRIASPGRSATLARALGERVQTAYVRVAGGKHGMLRRHALFDGLAADFALATLLGIHRSEAIGRIEAGECWLTL